MEVVERAAEDTADRERALRELQILDTPGDPAFDDVALLASKLCDAPVSLVSLVDAGRQWFKARVGFPSCETDLDRSVCRYVVRERETVIIPDLAVDPRTSDNPLRTGEPHVRFYAGAPLTMADGHVMGALCVLDHRPRPEGLTDAQQRGLEALGRQVVELIETRRIARDYAAAVEARDMADAERAAVEHRWQGLFQNLNEGFILGRVVRDGEGRAIDWRYEQVNDAWYDLVGIPHGAAIGRTIREVFPGIEEEWVREMVDVAETGHSIEFTRQVGSLSRWYHGAAQPAGPDQFTVLFLEVTDRVLATAHQDALLQLGDRLRDRRKVDEMVADAAEVVGTTLGADRAAYGEFFHDDQRVRLSEGWAKPGMPPIAGEYRFSDYGNVQEDIVSGRLLVIEDVLVDPRTASDLAPWKALNIRAALLTAVMDRERPVAMLLVNWAEPHAVTPEEIAFARNAADRLEIGIARQRAEDRQELLNGELAHRMKNSLSVVQAIANQTLGSAGDREAVIAFGERLSALAKAHDVLLARSWEAADFGHVARAEFYPKPIREVEVVEALRRLASSVVSQT